MTGLISINNKYFLQSEALYNDSFPPEERRNFSLMPNLMQNKPFEFWAFEKKGVFSGFISLWSFENFVYAEHFAVVKHLRGQGVGSEIISMVKVKYKKPIVLEVEPECDGITRKRIDFYRKNGFVMSEEKYMQPPYADNLPWVELKIMKTDKNLPFEEIKNTLYKNVYNQ